ncbi:MAG: hypothetical protein CML73_03040 [Rhodobiaceae bacterium]|nr:hypothetical protein [Rhodobiaceae bacterium]
MVQDRLTSRAYIMNHSPVILLVGLSAICATVFALAVDVDIKPDQQGYEECRELHPERFCRIFNGFEV